MRQPHYKQVRELAFAKASQAMDYLIIFLTQKKAYPLLSEVNFFFTNFFNLI